MSTGVIISQPMEYCIPIIIGKILHVVAYIISAWALTLSVLQYRAMRRPLSVGQTTGSSHAFFMFVLTDKLIRLVNREQAGRKVLLIR